MSPENQGGFLSFERSDFSENSHVLQLAKMGSFFYYSCATGED
jgi:hypothetical protein